MRSAVSTRSSVGASTAAAEVAFGEQRMEGSMLLSHGRNLGVSVFQSGREFAIKFVTVVLWVRSGRTEQYGLE